MLKAFYNWWEKSRYFFNNAIHTRWTLIGWKAALRWVLKDLCESGNRINEIRRLIKEELGD